MRRLRLSTLMLWCIVAALALALIAQNELFSRRQAAWEKSYVYQMEREYQAEHRNMLQRQEINRLKLLLTFAEDGFDHRKIKLDKGDRETMAQKGIDRE
jgi:hypothetical protein